MVMDDDGVQATAKTTRLFMGIQVQCTQCHNHPFNDWKQNQFWEFNNFFRQLDKVDHRKYDPKSGRMVDDYSEVVFKEFNENVFFEQRAGTLQMVKPRFFETRADVKPSTDLRKELAKLMVAGDDSLISRAMRDSSKTGAREIVGDSSRIDKPTRQIDESTVIDESRSIDESSTSLDKSSSIDESTKR